MSSQAPKFLINGVNFKNNFMGMRTIQTAVYGVAECGIKAVPIFALFYGVSKTPNNINFTLEKMTTFHINERDEVLDERKKQETTVRRAALEL